jgi:hypothetical protein
VSRYLPPMAGGSDVRIVPGPIRQGTCPPPTEIVVVEARKVFDFCFQEDVLERCFFIPGLSQQSVVTRCEITNVMCREVLDREPIPDKDGFALVSVQVSLDLVITIQPSPNAQPITETRRIVFPKRTVLCAPTGTEVTCDVRGTCICTIQPNVGGTEPNLCCTIQLCLVVTSAADVKLLMPSFGMVMPQECQVSPVFGGCPPVPPDICKPLFGQCSSDK